MGWASAASKRHQGCGFFALVAVCLQLTGCSAIERCTGYASNNSAIVPISMGKLAHPAPIQLTAGDGAGLDLRKLQVRAVLMGPLAFTQAELSFHNSEHRQREGQLALTLPAGAVVSRFAMRKGGTWQEGEVVEKQRARQIYEDFLHRRQDPALLEQDAGNVFRARVFPIPPDGDVELLVSWSQELGDSQGTYSLPLVGLPKLQKLSIQAFLTDPGAAASPIRTVKFERKNSRPDADFEIAAADLPDRRAALRSGPSALARVVIPNQTAPAGFDKLLILLDTSVSQQATFEAAVKTTLAIASLAEQHGASQLRVIAFDQDVQTLFVGPPGQLTARALRQRQPLGATNLQRALEAISPEYSRVVIVGDGLVTAGARTSQGLRKSLQAHASTGLRRVDAVTIGSQRDSNILQALTSSGLPEHGVVLAPQHGRLDLAGLALTSHGRIVVHVPGSSWSWPDHVDGLQPGQSLLVYAELPQDQPLQVQLSGAVSETVQLQATDAPSVLLERAAVAAHIRLLLQQAAEAQGPQEVALREQATLLSVRHRVLCPETALLVLESEADYVRYHLDRKALADVLTVTERGEVVMHKRLDPLGNAARTGPAEAQPTSPSGAAGQTFVEPAGPAGQRPKAPQPTEPDDKGDRHEKSKFYDFSDQLIDGEVKKPSTLGYESTLRARNRGRPYFDYDDEGGPAKPATPAKAALLRGQRMREPALTGPFAEIETLRGRGELKAALAKAQAWQQAEPGELLAYVALARALHANGQSAQAARAAGSLLDLQPGRADIRRFAGNLLESLGSAGNALAVDTYQVALADRPDHPGGYHMLAMALARDGKYLQAIDVLVGGLGKAPRANAFAQVERVLREDLGVLAAAWLHGHPQQRAEVQERLGQVGAHIAEGPSARFVLSWETDANDVDLHVFDKPGSEAWFGSPVMPSGGQLFADVVTGLGPECFAVERPEAFPYYLQVHYYNRGAMGFGMGRVQVVRYDGKGGLAFDERPFVIMNDHAWIDLGSVAR